MFLTNNYIIDNYILSTLYWLYMVFILKHPRGDGAELVLPSLYPYFHSPQFLYGSWQLILSQRPIPVTKKNSIFPFLHMYTLNLVIYVNVFLQIAWQTSRIKYSLLSMRCKIVVNHSSIIAQDHGNYLNKSPHSLAK